MCTALCVLPLVVVAVFATGGSERATLEGLSDAEKLSLIDLLPMRAPVDQALALCPRLEQRGRKYEEHWEAQTSLYGQPATLWCDFRAGCLYQILLELRSVPAASASDVFQRAVAHYDPLFGATEQMKVDDAEVKNVTASRCTNAFGLQVS
jgi:hypothetical protein